MIPIRDTIQSKSYPVLNSSLIAVNVLVFLLEMVQGERLSQFIFTYGLVPARYSIPSFAAYFTAGQQAFSLVSYMFVHGSFWHLLGNMWFLYIFGDNVEDRLGSPRYLLFYLLCGWTSGLVHLFINWHSHIPTIGASGAIAGVMGAYFILFSGSRILTLIPIFFFPWLVEIPAYFFLGIWFLFQFIGASGSSSQAGGIAWWAHVGGFVAGIAFLQLFLGLPSLGLSRALSNKTFKRSSPRLQLIRTQLSQDDQRLQGTLLITPAEARSGAQKLVSVSRGYQKRLLRIRLPAGIRDGTVLRLGEMGRLGKDVKRGDLYLKVKIRKDGDLG